MSVIQMGRKCRRCGSFRHPREFVGGPFGYCFFCYERHRVQDAMLRGAMPVACQECKKTLDEIGDVPMQLHWKDGLYELLCQACGDAYVVKRKDLYGKTPFAEVAKL